MAFHSYADRGCAYLGEERAFHPVGEQEKIRFISLMRKSSCTTQIINLDETAVFQVVINDVISSIFMILLTDIDVT